MNHDIESIEAIDARSEYESELQHDHMDILREQYESEGWNPEDYPFEQWLEDY